MLNLDRLKAQPVLFRGKSSMNVTVFLNILLLVFVSFLALFEGNSFGSMFNGIAGALVTFLWIVCSEVEYARN